MIIRNPISIEELHLCAEIYIAQNDNEFLYIEPSVCKFNIVNQWKMNRYIRVIEHDGKVVGFIAASPNTSKHSTLKQFVQEYYVTNLKGFASARAVIAAHRDMVDYAIKHRYHLVISQGSHMDPEFVFTRILERNGWKRKGHVALKYLTDLPAARLELPLHQRGRTLGEVLRAG